ncbi:MAG TPA: serine kinase [Pseudolabrys sp.]|nr:serine kinase [Pseudolabrys sp.]
MTNAPSIHASAVLIGAKAVLIRGPAGSGKSRLVWQILEAAQSGALPFARLVGDDRLHLEAHHGRLLVRPAPALAGLLEMRGLGIRKMPHESVAAVSVVVDLAAADAERLPVAEASGTTIDGVRLPRLAFAAGSEPLHPLLAFVRT